MSPEYAEKAKWARAWERETGRLDPAEVLRLKPRAFVQAALQAFGMLAPLYRLG